jgi:hypothetical protein
MTGARTLGMHRQAHLVGGVDDLREGAWDRVDAVWR